MFLEKKAPHHVILFSFMKSIDHVLAEAAERWNVSRGRYCSVSFHRDEAMPLASYFLFPRSAGKHFISRRASLDQSNLTIIAFQHTTMYVESGDHWGYSRAACPYLEKNYGWRPYRAFVIYPPCHRCQAILRDARDVQCGFCTCNNWFC